MKVPTDLAGLAKLILSPQCKSIVMLTGAGVSVSSGIPDFRSPGGMYDTLQPDLITATKSQREAMRIDPTAVVERTMFLQTAFPYLEVRRPFILGTRDKKWKATIAHRFAELLHTNTGKLTRVFTQNIDSLDFQCKGLPPEKIVSVHGTIGKAACESCGAEVSDFNKFCDDVRYKIKDIYGIDEEAPSESSPIPCERCGKPTVKPCTVLFGGTMPKEFFLGIEEDMPSVDMLIVAGTSLVVAPANFMVKMISRDGVRVIVNREPVGMGLGIEYGTPNEQTQDFFAQGNCDDVFLDLIGELGWMDGLAAIEDELPESSAELLRGRLRGRTK